MTSNVTTFQNTSEVLTVDGDTCFVSPSGTIDTTGDGVTWDNSVDTETVVNQGYIFGNRGIAGSAVATNRVYNSGHIDSQAVAITLSNNSFDLVSNTGTISGSDGVFVGGSGITITNSGTISTSGDGLAVGTTSDARISNSGLIEADDDAMLLSGSGSYTIKNSGELAGTVNMQFASGTTYLKNSGKIDGDVIFGSGGATFDGRGGSVAGGTITGGAKADTFYLGNDGESVGGGGGHDTIYAGTGDDIFAFSSFASADSDKIFGFNVSDDLVQLDHATFTKLAAGATPAFSNASAATSAHDYLFYNTANGGLYYDADGNGAGKANLIAKLDTGLQLTAHDFRVV